MFCLPFYPSLVDHLSYSIWKKISQIWLIATCHKMQNEYNVCLAHTHTRTDTHAHKSWLLLLFFLKMTLVNWKITWKLLQLALLWNWNCKLDGKSLGHLHFVFVHTHTHTCIRVCVCITNLPLDMRLYRQKRETHYLNIIVPKTFWSYFEFKTVPDFYNLN